MQNWYCKFMNVKRFSLRISWKKWKSPVSYADNSHDENNLTEYELLTCLSPSLSRDSWSLRAVITWFLTVLLAMCVALANSSHPARHWPVRRHCATVSCTERSACRDWASLVPAVHRPLSVCTGDNFIVHVAAQCKYYRKRKPTCKYVNQLPRHSFISNWPLEIWPSIDFGSVPPSAIAELF